LEATFKPRNLSVAKNYVADIAELISTDYFAKIKDNYNKAVCVKIVMISRVKQIWSKHCLGAQPALHFFNESGLSSYCYSSNGHIATCCVVAAISIN